MAHLTRAGVKCSENGHCTSDINTQVFKKTKINTFNKVPEHFSNEQITPKSEISSTVITETINVG